MQYTTLGTTGLIVSVARHRSRAGRARWRHGAREVHDQSEQAGDGRADRSDLFANILEAHRAIRPQVAVTPLEHSATLSAAFGCKVLLKHDQMQPTGSFKVRGATNKIRRLSQESRRAKVLAASTGNHGLAVARAGALAGVAVTVYVGSSAVPSKMAGIRALGAELVVVDGPPFEAELAARRRAEAEGDNLVPAALMKTDPVSDCW